MGNVDSRSQFHAGNMIVQTDQPYYSPNDMVTGKIYLRINTMVDATHLELEVKGKEKGSWMDYEIERHNNPDGTIRHERKDIKRKSEKLIMHFKQPCFQFTGGLMPGDYTIPFQFHLPQGIPSSIIFSKKNVEKKPKAKVKYTIKVKLATRSHMTKEMHYKQVLIVRETPPNFEMMINQQSKHNITTWCCLNQGFSEI